MTSKNTSITIEAFPRSANTYSVAVFRYLYGDSLNISSHQHSVAQVRLAIKYSVPVLVIIRDPFDAVLSLAIRRSDISIKHLLAEYIKFYREISKIKDRVVLVDFDKAVNDFSSVISDINHKFGTKYKLYNKSKNSEECLKNIIEEMERDDSGGRELRQSHIAYPSERRMNSHIRDEKSYELKRYPQMMKMAKDIFNELH